MSYLIGRRSPLEGKITQEGLSKIQFGYVYLELSIWKTKPEHKRGADVVEIGGISDVTLLGG